MELLGVDCCASPRDSDAMISEVVRDRFEKMCAGEDTLPAEKLGDLLELLFDHLFTTEECAKLAARTGSGRTHQKMRELRATVAPNPRLTWSECEYIIDLCERRYPLLDPEQNKRRKSGLEDFISETSLAR